MQNYGSSSCLACFSICSTGVPSLIHFKDSVRFQSVASANRTASCPFFETRRTGFCLFSVRHGHKMDRILEMYLKKCRQYRRKQTGFCLNFVSVACKTDRTLAVSYPFSIRVRTHPGRNRANLQHGESAAVRICSS